MDVSSVLIELYNRIPPLADHAVDGLDPEQLRRAPADGANNIGWLIWHLARVQDHHVADLLGAQQVWESQDWADRFGLTPDPSNIGYGHSAEDVATVRPSSAETLLGYLAEVQTRTVAMVQDLTEADLDQIVDRRWDPPVSMGVRLISIADDSLQHVGQANYLRGVYGW